jgi:hypothetical protein
VVLDEEGESMTEIDLRPIGDTIVLHIRKEGHSINAYLLAATLVALADAAKEANERINPGYEIEVVVEALSDGSIKAVLRTIYRSLGNLFSKEALNAIILGIVATYIYEHALAPDKKVGVIVNSGEVIVEQENTKVIIPREVYEAEQKVNTSSRFQDKVGEAFDAMLKDPSITSLSLAADTSVDKESSPIPRKVMELIAMPPKEGKEVQVVDEIADLQIIRAILEKSKRRWEFSWRGFSIPAPILDDKFYSDFISHQIVIAPGDKLKVNLRIYQRRDLVTGIYVNDRYEIIQVLQHEAAKRYAQTELQ